MSSVHLCGLMKSFGDQTVIENLDLTIEAGAYVVLLGPSGCGKTTTLRMIAGLEAPVTGKVVMDGNDMTRVPPRKRDVSMVFQNDGLYPHLTVEQTIRLSLRGRCSKIELESRVSDAVRMTGVETLLGKLPRQLSGGELRRAALATAIVKKTAVRLLDEPLSGLDVAVRQRLQKDIMQWHRSVPGTTVHVTHDGSEAMRMADQIAVMDGGRVIQVGSPEQVYDHPKTIAVAKAIGTPTMNWLQAELVDGVIQTNDPSVATVEDALQVDGPDGPVVIGVRPNAFRILSDRDGDSGGQGIAFQAVMQDCRAVEESHEVVLSASGWRFIAVFDRFEPSVAGSNASSGSQDLALWVPSASLHVFSRLTQQRLKFRDVG
ncbi:ABC transporter ATP-binding protein [Rubripirellula sp.]|nr:ABC transporter ATP-binding protein [Rubripirellula sp.]